MKFTIAFALFATAAEAFSPAAFGVRSSTQLASRVDSSDLVAEALEISKKFGATSKEARLAWEAVEEIDSSDNSAATKGSLAEECEITEEEINAACVEYESKMEELNSMLKAQQPAIAALQDMAAQVQKVKLAVPASKPAPQSAALTEALADAKRITEEKGLKSPEAAVAWETVEELAAADNSASLGGAMTEDECLVEAAAEACEALSELSRVIGDRS
eukprot:CAMPEP_0117006840 /NCGR_PEP_ID=MMETSP0472-20121206/6934_1 /TAXON_ID=693140 ORGANISM="Tiarina fusus, Strain LIS" /NCGR_SAMPLE_ID=MMETSP0472 /ASSEMBLY_ACC=CAM_ASM_000603 /LENGTH=217 /DNA_ID=CAMNT_0004708439 /DNA_START=89 /DNA_END=742 /DNA_ORIENTATION=+